MAAALRDDILVPLDWGPNRMSRPAYRSHRTVSVRVAGDRHACRAAPPRGFASALSEYDCVGGRLSALFQPVPTLTYSYWAIMVWRLQQKLCRRWRFYSRKFRTGWITLSTK